MVENTPHKEYKRTGVALTTLDKTDFKTNKKFPRDKERCCIMIKVSITKEDIGIIFTYQQISKIHYIKR